MRGVLSVYRRLLRNRALTRLLAGEFVSSIGDWIYLVALLIILYSETGDAVLLGIVGAARVLPYVFLSIPAGFVADRFDRRMVLLVTDLGRGALMLLLAWLAATDGSIEAIVAVTILATCFSTFFGPAIGAYLPGLVEDERDLGPANTAYASLDNVAFVLGPAAAALILSVSDVAVAFVLNAVSFAFVAAVLWTLPSPRGGEPVTDGSMEVLAQPEPVPPDHAAGPPGGLVEGPGVMADAGGATPVAVAPRPGFDWRTARVPLGALLLYDLVESFVFGGLNILTVIIAFDVIGGGEAATGALNAAVGVGGLVGALVSGVLVLRRRLAPPMLFGALAMAVGVAALGLTSSLGLAMLAMAVGALGSLLTSVVGETLFQRIVPDAVRGRAIGVLETVSVLVFAAGSLLLPTMVGWWGIAPVLLASGVAVALAAVIAVWMLGPWSVQAPPVDAMRARISELPIFTGLRPARLETAERIATVVPMDAGQVVIRQGAVADRFYVIGEGEVEVTQESPDAAAPRVLRRMGVGEAFGEIGLLTGSPRTATVTALTAGTLVALEKDDFLSLVNGAGLTFPFLELHRGASASG